MQHSSRSGGTTESQVKNTSGPVEQKSEVDGMIIMWQILLSMKVKSANRLMQTRGNEGSDNRFAHVLWVGNCSSEFLFENMTVVLV